MVCASASYAKNAGPSSDGTTATSTEYSSPAVSAFMSSAVDTSVVAGLIAWRQRAERTHHPTAVNGHLAASSVAVESVAVRLRRASGSVTSVVRVEMLF